MIIRAMLLLGTLATAGLGLGLATRTPPPPVTAIAAAADNDDDDAAMREQWSRDTDFLNTVRSRGDLVTLQGCPPGYPCQPSGGDLLNTAATLCTRAAAGATHDELVAAVIEQYPSITTSTAAFVADESLRTQCTTRAS